MATTKVSKVRAARRRTKNIPVTSGTTYHVVQDGDGPRVNLIPLTDNVSIALVKAQTLAEKLPEPGTFYVERHTLFGNPTDLFMVRRDEDEVVRTFTLTLED